VECVVGLQLEGQKPPCVTPVSAAPGVAARRRFEVGAAGQQRHVIEDGAKQGMGSVGIAPAVVVVQFVDQLHELPGI
jgi:hypothetical protein